MQNQFAYFIIKVYLKSKLSLRKKYYNVRRKKSSFMNFPKCDKNPEGTPLLFVLNNQANGILYGKIDFFSNSDKT